MLSMDLCKFPSILSEIPQQKYRGLEGGTRLNFAFQPTFPTLFSVGAGRRACFICGDQFAEEDDVMEVLTLAKQTSLTQGWMD